MKDLSCPLNLQGSLILHLNTFKTLQKMDSLNFPVLYRRPLIGKQVLPFSNVKLRCHRINTFVLTVSLGYKCPHSICLSPSASLVSLEINSHLSLPMNGGGAVWLRGSSTIESSPMSTFKSFTLQMLLQRMTLLFAGNCKNIGVPHFISVPKI